MQEMRIQAAEQRLGEFRVIVVELFRGARIEQRARLDQASDVRILAAFRPQAQLGGQFRILVGELAADRVQVDQLALVLGQQRFHCILPQADTLRSVRSRAWPL